MADNSSDRLTSARRFLEPSNSTHRQYEALRAFFVEGLPSSQAAARFGYTPGSFRVLVHQFCNQPGRRFLLSPAREVRPPGKQKRLRDQVVSLRKQNLSVHDISSALAREDESLSPAAVAAILKEEGFAKLPRRWDEERPDRPRPVVGDVANVRQPDLVSANLDAVLERSSFPGSKMVPAACAMRSLLGLKLFGNARHSHVMSSVLDEGLALFAGLNVIPKRSFLTEYSCRIEPSCYPTLMRCWFDTVSRLGLRWGRPSTSTSIRSHFTVRTRWSRSTTSPNGAGNRKGSWRSWPRTPIPESSATPTPSCASNRRTMRSSASSPTGSSGPAAFPRNSSSTPN